MKPYIEFNGNKYEFEATFRLQKEYRKEIKDLESKNNADLISALGPDGIRKVQEAQDKLSKAKTEKEKEEIEKEYNALNTMDSKTLVLAYDKINSQEDKLNEINEHYCYLMLNNKYPEIGQKEFEEIENTIANDQGYDYVLNLFSSICNKVFHSVDKGTPQKTFSWEENKQIN